MERRTFLNWVVTSSGAIGVALTLPGCERDKKKTPGASPDAPAPDAGAAAAPAALGFLTEAEAACVTAAVSRLLPADPETGAPDAADLGVVGFIDSQLQLPQFEALHRMMRAGFKFMDQLAKRRHQKDRFADLTGEQQDAILDDLANGAVEKLKFPQERFFRTLHTFALEGYWGAPRHGGNRDELAWRWVDINPHCAHMHGGTCGD